MQNVSAAFNETIKQMNTTGELTFNNATMIWFILNACAHDWIHDMNTSKDERWKPNIYLIEQIAGINRFSGGSNTDTGIRTEQERIAANKEIKLKVDTFEIIQECRKLYYRLKEIYDLTYDVNSTQRMTDYSIFTSSVMLDLLKIFILNSYSNKNNDAAYWFTKHHNSHVKLHELYEKMNEIDEILLYTILDLVGFARFQTENYMDDMFVDYLFTHYEYKNKNDVELKPITRNYNNLNKMLTPVSMRGSPTGVGMFNPSNEIIQNAKTSKGTPSSSAKTVTPVGVDEFNPSAEVSSTAMTEKKKKLVSSGGAISKEKEIEFINSMQSVNSITEFENLMESYNNLLNDSAVEFIEYIKRSELRGVNIDTEKELLFKLKVYYFMYFFSEKYEGKRTSRTETIRMLRGGESKKRKRENDGTDSLDQGNMMNHLIARHMLKYVGFCDDNGRVNQQIFTSPDWDDFALLQGFILYTISWDIKSKNDPNIIKFYQIYGQKSLMTSGDLDTRLEQSFRRLIFSSDEDKIPMANNTTVAKYSQYEDKFILKAPDNTIDVNNKFDKQKQLMPNYSSKKFIINNAANLLYTAIEVQKFCPMTSVMDGMSMCSWNKKESDGLEYGNINVALASDKFSYRYILKHNSKEDVLLSIEFTGANQPPFFMRKLLNIKTGKDLNAPYVLTTVLQYVIQTFNSLTQNGFQPFRNLSSGSNVHGIWVTIESGANYMTEIIKRGIIKSTGDIGQEMSALFKKGGIDYNTQPNEKHEYIDNNVRAFYANDRPSALRYILLRLRAEENEANMRDLNTASSGGYINQTMVDKIKKGEVYPKTFPLLIKPIDNLEIHDVFSKPLGAPKKLKQPRQPKEPKEPKEPKRKPLKTAPKISKTIKKLKDNTRAPRTSKISKARKGLLQTQASVQAQTQAQAQTPTQARGQPIITQSDRNAAMETARRLLEAQNTNRTRNSMGGRRRHRKTHKRRN